MSGVERARGERKCDACGRQIPPGNGTHWIGYDLFVCLDGCHERVRLTTRVYDRSARGRWRPRSEVRRMVLAMRT